MNKRKTNVGQEGDEVGIERCEGWMVWRRWWLSVIGLRVGGE